MRVTGLALSFVALSVLGGCKGKALQEAPAPKPPATATASCSQAEQCYDFFDTDFGAQRKACTEGTWTSGIACDRTKLAAGCVLAAAKQVRWTVANPGRDKAYVARTCKAPDTLINLDGTLE